MTRTGHNRLLPVLSGIAALSISAMAFAQQSAPAFSGTDLVEPPTTGWPTNGGDWYNRRHSPLTEINRDNVQDLRGVWRARLNGSGVGPQYSGAAQPIVYDGVVYVITGANDVFAISVDSGEILWTYESELDPAINTICCSWTNRGVSLGDGRIYFGRLDGRLVALDQRTGEELWNIQAERWQEGFSITSTPLYYDGLVITGFSGAEFGVRGRVRAYDATDGSLVWTFYTIPGPGEPGHETWSPDNDIWMHGGATVWQTPTVDPELGLIYFTTGNPGPDFNGAVRPGDNLYTSSIMALDVRTGEYRWHFQQVRHDLWDYDSANPVILFDLEYDGELRRGIAHAGKTGWVYILDRTNGEPIIGIEDRPVPQEPRQATAATQPYPVGESFIPQHVAIAPEGYRLVNDGRVFTPFWTEAVVVKPGLLGGANWPPSSVDPNTGLMYICAHDRAGVYRAHDIDDEPPPDGQMYTGGDIMFSPLPSYGIFVAMDLRTNTIAWRQHWSDSCYSGSVNTAGGLVFVGRNDGRLTALNSATGARLWEFQTGAGMNAPATVFEHEGRQYVVAYSGGSLFAGTQRGDSVWLFSLDGTMEPVTAGTGAGATPEAETLLAAERRN